MPTSQKQAANHTTDATPKPATRRRDKKKTTPDHGNLKSRAASHGERQHQKRKKGRFPRVNPWYLPLQTCGLLDFTTVQFLLGNQEGSFTHG